MHALTVRKWYLDAANPAGEVWIGYHAGLDWAPLHLDFTHQLRRSAADGICEHGALRSVVEPYWADADTLHWSCAGLDACWRRSGSPPISETLFESDEGRIVWSCVLPRARATIRTDAGVLEGAGYVDHLELALTTWRLPLTVLHWGRCHAESHDLVWIRWDGAEPRALAWLDGVRHAATTITETTVVAGGARWECGARVTLRRGALGRTLLAPLRSLGSGLPAAALAADEHKWYAHGRLIVDGVDADAVGIAERVAW